MAATDVGTGTAITFQSGLLAEITNIDLGGMSVPVIDAPHMGGNGLFNLIVGRLKRPPEMTVDINFDPDEDWPAKVGAAAETVTITFPTPAGGSTGATWAFSGKLVSFEPSIPNEDVMTGTAVIQALTIPVVTAST